VTDIWTDRQGETPDQSPWQEARLTAVALTVSAALQSVAWEAEELALVLAQLLSLAASSTPIKRCISLHTQFTGLFQWHNAT